MLSAAAALTACELEPKDLFSTAPVAPILSEPGNILMTEYSANEDVVFSWSAARNVEGAVTYELMTKYNGGAVEYNDESLSGIISDNKYALKKGDFADFLEYYDVPLHQNFKLSFYVKVYVNGSEAAELQSESVDATVFVNTENVAPVLTALKDVVVLTVEELDNDLELLSWTAPFIGVNEDVSAYYVLFRKDAGEPWQTLAALDADALTYTRNVDSWNDFFTENGWEAGVDETAYFCISAKSASTGDEGMMSNEVSVNVTTFDAIYPDYMYLAGNHQSWDPATAPSIQQSSTKGLYEGFVDLKSDGDQTEFKFCVQPSWGGDFGSDDVAVDTDNDGNTVVTGKVGASDNIAVPSGFYRVSLDYKRKTLLMVKVESMGLVGSAVPGVEWDQTKAVEMEYDADKGRFSVNIDLVAGEFKAVLNKSWTYSVAGNGTYEGGNYTVSADGNYDVILDVNTFPFTWTLKNTAYPEQLWIPGDHDSWAHSYWLPSTDTGKYAGFAALVNPNGDSCEWKFDPTDHWSGDFASPDFKFDEATGEGAGTTGGGGNITIPNGVYYIEVDMTADSFTVLRVDKVGLVGPATPGEWDAAASTAMEYDATNKLYTFTGELAADEFKICINDGWDINRGGDGVAADGKAYEIWANGPNMGLNEAGTYEIKADLFSVPNTITITKK